MSSIESDTEDFSASLFEEPSSFRPPSPKPKKSDYTLLKGSPTLTLNLVGSSPLWGHILWHTSTTLAGYLEQNPSLVREKSILEFGAGAGLPSLVSAVLGARKVCITDYPDRNLVDNLELNVTESRHLWNTEIEVVAEGFVWGGVPGAKMQNMLDSDDGAFDLLILSDLLFNHSEHGKLLGSIRKFMRKHLLRSGSRDGRSAEDCPRALVFFTPHRPWLYEKDLGFFDLARQEGFAVEKIFEEVLSKPMFEHDKGDEKMRRTVEGWEIRWS